MGKRRDKGDPTMEVSTSQLVGGRGDPSRGDASVWKQVVVGTDQFAPAPNPPKSKSRRKLVVGLVGAIAVGGGAAVYLGMSDSAKPVAIAIDAAPVPVVAPPTPAASPVDAAAPPVDAPPPPPPGDAAAPDDAGTDVDAGVPHKHHFPNKRHNKHHKAS